MVANVAMASELTTLFRDWLSAVTRLVRSRGAAFSRWVFRDIIISPMPPPIRISAGIRSTPVVVPDTRLISTIDPATRVNPTSTGGRAPIRSYSRPPTCMNTMDASACGIVTRPASKDP
jgi:hypothetical protein